MFIVMTNKQHVIGVERAALVSRGAAGQPSKPELRSNKGESL
jgi:hypothetical protein